MFEQTVTARFNHIDYAGRLFYGTAFEYVHHVEEDFFESLGWPIQRQKEELGILFPLATVEAEFHNPIKLGDQLSLELSINDIEEYTFKLHCTACNRESDQKAFDVDLTRICMNVKSEEAQSIPAAFRNSLGSDADRELR